MKTKAYRLLLSVLALVITSCDAWEDHIIPTSTVSSMDYTFTDFESINASHAFQVYLTFSESEESIVIEANDNLHEYIEVKKENNTLSIGIRNGIQVKGLSTLKAHITTNHVSNFYGSGASSFQLANAVECQNAAIYLSGASHFSGELYASDLTIELSGASTANLSGSADLLKVELTGASAFRDYNFATGILKADLSGSSSAFLTVVEQIDVKASGGSSLHYKGDAVIKNQELSGSSKISMQK